MRRPNFGQTVMYRALHRSAGSGDALGKALATIPEYVAATDALHGLDAFAASGTAAPVGSVDDLLDRAIAAGKGIDTDLLNEVGLATAREAAPQALAAAINRRRERLTNELDNALHNGARRILRHLNGQLRQMLDEARPLAAALDGTQTLEHACQQDQVDEFRAFEILGKKYQSLRQAQASIVTNFDPVHIGMQNDWRYRIANPLAVDPDFVPRELGLIVLANDEDTRFPNDAPWPDKWDEDGYATLAWLCAHPEAEPWVPDWRDMERLGERLEGIYSDVQSNLIKMPGDTHRSYYRPGDHDLPPTLITRSAA